MFYSHLVLTKKGPLGHVWLAAQLGENRVPKRFASQAKIDLLCSSIEQPAAPFALRLSAHLMMGVTRVYSRKSAIVLSNATKVLSALHRMHAETLELNRKRGRSAVAAAEGVESATQLAINNNVTESPARFEDITLPDRPRKRLRRKSTDTFALDLPYFSVQDAVINKIEHSHSNGIGSLGLDIQFPSVQFGGSDTRPRTRITSFRAREEDITLRPGSDMVLGSQDFVIDLSDIPRDINLNQTSPQQDQEDGASSYDNGSAEFAAAFGRKTNSSPRGTTSTRSGAPGRSMLDPSLVLEPMIVEDVPISQRVQDRTSAIATDAPSNRTDGAKGGVSSRTVRRSKRSSTETLRTKRSAGILSERMHYTEQTEFSTRQIRDWQATTSDIVIPPGVSRPYARRSKAALTDTLEDLFSVSNPFRDMAFEVANLWIENVVQPCLAELDIEPAMEGNNDVAGVSSSKGSVPRSAESRRSYQVSGLRKSPRLPSQSDDMFTDRPVDMPTPPQGTDVSGPAPTQMDIPMAEPEPVLGSALPPLFPMIGSKSGSLKDGSPSKGLSVRSVPSDSGGGISVGHSSSAGSRAPERLRDNELEVTPQDRAEFAKARRLSGAQIRLQGLSSSATPTARETAEEVPLMATTANLPKMRRSASEQELEMQNLAGDVADAERLPVGESDLRLEEQTEDPLRVDSEQDGLTAIERLNVHSFKLLQILRTVETHEVGGDVRICAFADLVDGMSRRGCSHAYLNLLALVSAGFVRVEQIRSYGPINIRPGKFF